MINPLRPALILAAAAGLAAPASAVDRPGLASAASAAGVTVHRGSGLIGDPLVRRGGRFDRRCGLEGAVYLGDREYQGDTAWRSTSFNDWWHDRPDRNEPRWLRSNNCERQFWTGSGWRC